jgi:hypothetical protein
MTLQTSLAAERLLITSYGVTIEIGTNNSRLTAEAKKAIRIALAGQFKVVSADIAEHAFFLQKTKSSGVDLFKNSELKYSNLETSLALERLSSELRLTVAEFAVERVFIHAGAVGWKGKGIIFPARSFKGKSSLTAALVRCGARYYSDEYAILDKRGMLHSFPKDLSLRGIKDEFSQTEHTVESLGGRAGKRPIPVKLILLTEFQKSAKWKPEPVTPGTAAMDVINNCVSIRRQPEFVLPVVNRVTSSSVAVRSKRGDAEVTAPFILELLNQI